MICRRLGGILTVAVLVTLVFGAHDLRVVGAARAELASSPISASPRPSDFPASPALVFVTPTGYLGLGAVDTPGFLTLSSLGRTVWSPVWSPDGRYLAFTRCERETICAAYVVGRTSTRARFLTSSGHGIRWLGDSKHVITGISERFDEPGYFVVAVRNGAKRRLTIDGLQEPLGTLTPSPDGRWLLHTTQPYGRVAPSRGAPHHYRARNWLMITDLETRRSRTISSTPGFYMLSAAAWSSDSTTLTYTRREYLQAGVGAVYVFDVATGTTREVGRGATGGASWSPDGRRLAFNLRDCRIRVISLEETETARVLSYAGCEPTWRPDS